MAIISLNGTPGSGKSTLAKLLAARLGYRYYSIGELRRKHAQKQGLTLAEYNRRSEAGEEDTDTEFDDYQKQLGKEEDGFVIDSRLGWHFIPGSIKLLLDADEQVRAERLHSRESVAESASNIDEAIAMNARRMASDTARYEKYYQLDPWNTEHYDLVLDSTSKTPEELVAQIIEKFPALKK